MQVRGRLLSRRTLLSALLLFATLTTAFQPNNAYAAQITSRSLTLLAGTTDGGSKPGGVVNHLFTFSVPSATAVGSVQLQYCTVASGTCVMPTGLVTNTSGTTLGGNTGAISGLTLVNTSAPNGTPYLTRTAAAVTPGQVTIQLNGVTNPTTTNQTFFVRITTFGSTDTTGTSIDSGTVAASTATQIQLSGTMPESLIFCAGKTVGVNGGGMPDCTTATPGIISFNQLFSPTDTATATSQMAASTNASAGYSITVTGTTLTSGANTIPAMSAAALGTRGNSQFGMNLMANTTTTSTPAVGAAVTPAANVPANLRGQATTGYNTIDTFKYTSGDSVANSAAGGAGPTNAQIFTTSYMVNVAGSQPAGSYVTTLTYVCTATF